MKDKILKAELMTACEHIARALRSYTGEPLGCSAYIGTRKDGEDCDEAAIEVHWNTDQEDGELFSKKVRIYYSFDKREGEQIRRVEVMQEEGDENDS